VLTVGVLVVGSGKTAAFLVPVLARLYTTGQRAEDREKDAMVSSLLVAVLRHASVAIF